jgi:predicted aspartyl protease
MRSPLSLLILACALLVSGCALPIPGTSSGRDHRLRQLGYHPQKLQKTSGDVRYSGKFLVNGQPVQLLIDSGANSTDIESAIALRAGVRPSKSLTVISRGALGRPVTSQVGVGTLTAGQITATPFPFMLTPASDRHTATSRYDGQLGLDALEGLGALVDLSSGNFWVPSQKARNAGATTISPLGPVAGLGFETLSLKRAGRLPHLILEGVWNGYPLSWVVDTGAEVTVLSTATIRRHGLPTVPTGSKIIDASGDNSDVSVASLKNVIFGRLVVSEYQVAVTPLTTVRQSFRDSRGRAVDGIIGMDFLARSGALLDSASALLYVGQPEVRVRSRRTTAAAALPVTLRVAEDR